MRQFEQKRFAAEMGLDPSNLSTIQSDLAWERVNEIWARPSDDGKVPTPQIYFLSWSYSHWELRTSDFSISW